MSDLYGNPEYMFSHDAAHLKVGFEGLLITWTCTHATILPFQMKEIDDLKQRTLKTENYIHGMESKLGNCKHIYKLQSFEQFMSPVLKKQTNDFAICE